MWNVLAKVTKSDKNKVTDLDKTKNKNKKSHQISPAAVNSTKWTVSVHECRSRNRATITQKNANTKVISWIIRNIF